jgi:hypothetical protein
MIDIMIEAVKGGEVKGWNMFITVLFVVIPNYMALYKI